MFLGINTHYFVKLNNGQQIEIIQQSDLESILPTGKTIKLKVNANKINIFDEAGTRNLLNGVVYHAD